jgi:ATP-dependent exoDNAse (exonuclease V) beta subunit
MRVPWMAEQERNLVYVAYTRAKHFLGFIENPDVSK